MKVLLNAAAHPTETVVCGDFNTRYGDPTCTNATNLSDLLETSGFVQHVNSPTHERGSILDLVITSSTSHIIATAVKPNKLIKSVLNLQMTYIIIAHIYEQWDR